MIKKLLSRRNSSIITASGCILGTFGISALMSIAFKKSRKGQRAGFMQSLAETSLIAYIIAPFIIAALSLFGYVMADDIDEEESDYSPLARLRKIGYNLEDGVECWEENGYLYFRLGSSNDPTGYLMQVDPDTGAHRNKGNGSGCIWTEWEGGDQ